MTALTAHDRHVRLLRWGGYPLALIAVTLVLLYLVPLFTNTRLQALRRHEADVSLLALVRVNDLEAALATETAARGEMTQGGGEEAAVQVGRTRLSVARDQRSLDSLVEMIGAAAVLRNAETWAAIAQYQRAEDDLIARMQSALTATDSATLRRQRWEALEFALASAQRLENELSARVNEEQRAIGRYERMNIYAPTALVPLALLSLIAVMWTARRIALLSQEASEGWLNAERAIAAKSALIRGVTHDLKNPLGAAAGYAELLVDGVIGPLPAKQAEVIEHMRHLIAATVDTVNDLVNLSQADTDGLRIDQQNTDLAVIVRDVANDYRAACVNAGITLDVDIPNESAVPVITDPARVRQVLGNLLSNATKYTPSGGRIRVFITTVLDPKLGNAFAIHVSDNGPGIPEQLRGRVFDEFFRVSTTSAVASGTGIGLAIARRMARLLDGDLRVSATEGGGATFTLLLPV